ncbi:MAG: hypothetical protein A3K19_15840 [Lentisphaerae bacterium RIFOXYB12_FULL_65_16]|nr:MAG: hypothetical protein A3K18_03260 [Lentisphaerae bacterium RIFOXYA12_64_32]OGV87353.1 MAG: hypothetical protein A3K19_15840 [Lentisphaerae bacterium RIFOXYB12_FULL_65_16]
MLPPRKATPTRILRRGVFGALWVLCLAAAAAGTPASAPPKGNDTATKLADGAVAVAVSLLSHDATDERGLNLLRFALAAAPNHTDALLLQAKLERGQELPQADLPDAGKGCIDFLQSVIRKTKPGPRQLLLWKVIELVDPLNEDALMALTKAKNSGTDTQFDNLLAALTGNPKTVPTLEPRTAAPPVARTDAGPLAAQEPGAPAPKQAGAARMRGAASYKDILTSRQVECACLMDGSFFGAVMQLNQALKSSGLAVYIDTSRPCVQLKGVNADGIPDYEGTGAWPMRYTLEGMIDGRITLGTVNAWDLLHRVCMLYDLGYWAEAGKYQLAEQANPNVVSRQGFPIDAETAVADIKSGHTETLQACVGKNVCVTGAVSAVEWSGPTVSLGGGQIEVAMNTYATPWLPGLKAAFERYTNAMLQVKATPGEYVLYGGKYMPKSVAARRILLFRGCAMGESLDNDRLRLGNCNEFWFVECFTKDPASTP